MNKIYPNTRVSSIDVLRGLVMVIMALDHVREFFHAEALQKDPLDIENYSLAIYFTRWITHYCAPIFVFLSGVSVGLSASNKPITDSSFSMFKRGFWLILVEVTLITFGLTFNPLFNVIIFQVIWAIGWSFILLGLVRLLSEKAVPLVGIAIILCHNLFDYYNPPQGSTLEMYTNIIFKAFGYVIPISDTRIILDLYAIVPWTGIMMLGYGIYPWFVQFTSAKRTKWLFSTGVGMVLAFCILRFFNNYGDPALWKPYDTSIQTFLSFINTSKYPPSLLYTLMTIGPAFLTLAVLERIRGPLSGILIVYGKVPFFYYVLHFYIIHILVAIIFFASGYPTSDIVPKNNPFLFRPDTFGFDIGIVYLIWFGVVASLYYPCLKFAAYKQKHKDKWWVHYC